MTTVHRYAIRRFFVSACLVVLAVFVFPGLNNAQEKTPAQKQPSPSPAQVVPSPSPAQLLTVTPATGAQKSGDSQKGSKEQEGPILINTDLVTLTVTVTD